MVDGLPKCNSTSREAYPVVLPPPSHQIPNCGASLVPCGCTLCDCHRLRESQFTYPIADWSRCDEVPLVYRRVSFLLVRPTCVPIPITSPVTRIVSPSIPPGLTKVAWISVEIPVLNHPCEATAKEPTESISVDIMPPCSVRARFTASVIATYNSLSLLGSEYQQSQDVLPRQRGVSYYEHRVHLHPSFLLPPSYTYMDF